MGGVQFLEEGCGERGEGKGRAKEGGREIKIVVRCRIKCANNLIARSHARTHARTLHIKHIRRTLLVLLRLHNGLRTSMLVQ